MQFSRIQTEIGGKAGTPNSRYFAPIADHDFAGPLNWHQERD
jgi:hypothetical protein